MAKTHNRYHYPVDLQKARMTYDESPGHVGALKHAVDFIVKEGTPVKAAQDGFVHSIIQNYKLGGPDKDRFYPLANIIDILHHNVEFSHYGHLLQYSARVKEGDYVKRGEVIALSGATGWLAHLGPHLHFDVGKLVWNRKRGEMDYKTLEIVFVKK